MSRGLEVHPHGQSEDLDVWIERSLVRRGYGWRVPAAGEARVGVASYAPAITSANRPSNWPNVCSLEPVRYQGNWFPHRLRPATEDSIFFVGDSAGHCFPLSGEGIRTAFYFGIACGRELTAVLQQDRSRAEALERYAAFSAKHARAFAIAGRLQRMIPALPPRLLTSGLRVLGRQWLIDRSFGWYLDQAHLRTRRLRRISSAAVRRASPGWDDPDSRGRSSVEWDRARLSPVIHRGRESIMPLGRRRPIARAAVIGTVAYQGGKRGAQAGEDEAQAAAPPEAAAAPPARRLLRRLLRPRTRPCRRSTSLPSSTRAVC